MLGIHICCKFSTEAISFRSDVRVNLLSHNSIKLTNGERLNTVCILIFKLAAIGSKLLGLRCENSYIFLFDDYGKYAERTVGSDCVLTNSSQVFFIIYSYSELSCCRTSLFY